MTYDRGMEMVTPAETAPRPTKGQRTRQRILDAAFDLFGARGFHAVSLRDIASAVGVTHVTVLHYFASKDDLLVELMVHRDEVERRAAQEYLETDAGRAEGGLHAPGLRWFMHRLEHFSHERGAMPLFLKISTEAADPEHPAHDHFTRRYRFVVDWLTAAFAEEFAGHPGTRFAVSPETAARHLVAIADGGQIQSIYAARPDRVAADAWAYLQTLGLERPLAG